MPANSVDDAYQSLKAALDIFKVDAPDITDTPTKQALQQAAEQVKTDAAKIGLMCSGGAPPLDQQVSLAAALQNSCITFCTLCHAATAAAGPSLKASLAKLAQDLVNPCLALLKDMGSGQDLKQHVGLVWERVSAVSKAPVDNKACLFAALAKVMAVVKDTLREMEELQQEQQEEYGNPPPPSSTPQAAAAAATAAAATAAAAAEHADIGADGADRSGEPTEASAIETAARGTAAAHAQVETSCSSSNGTSVAGSRGLKPPAGVDLDFEADEMSYTERQLLTCSIQLLQAAAAVVKAFGKVLLQGPGLAAGSDALEGWESCLWHSKHLQRAVEDLGAAMYPPQDQEEVVDAARAVAEVAELMLDECPDSDAVGAEQMSSLAEQLQKAHEALVQQAHALEGEHEAG